jgi:beta-1,4-mannooligosaccharide/beta-1,4-mannosyl-N-acetylglucosamine phosphorylase
VPPSTITCGPDLPNIPWEARPDGSSEVVWRYSGNPVISRHAIPNANLVDGATGRVAIY